MVVERNKVEAHTSWCAELRLLKEANIGGVEIYPVGLPEDTDGGYPDAQVKHQRQWIDMVKVTSAEADRLGMTCDLMVAPAGPTAAISCRTRQAQVVVAIRCGEAHRPHRVQKPRPTAFQTDRPGNNDARRQPRVRVAIASSSVPDRSPRSTGSGTSR
ncbi:MAG: hypothetical protein ACLR8Y_08860 [Alistipes indistinctus]